MPTTGNKAPADRVDQWIRFYASRNTGVQERALNALVAIDDPRVIPVLLDAFPHVGLRFDVVRALTRHRDPALVEPMLAYLTYPDHLVRQAACEVLGALQDTRATLPLVERLEDDHMMVRRAAAFALASLRDARAADAVRRHYEERSDEDINVRMGLRAALEALGVPHDKRLRRPAQGQAETSTPADLASAEMATDVMRAMMDARATVMSRDDLLEGLHWVRGHLFSLAEYGKVMSSYPKEAEMQTLRRLIEDPWKLGRSNGRRHRKQLQYFAMFMPDFETRPLASAPLPPEEREQAELMLAHVREMIALVGGEEDVRPHSDRMRAYLREMAAFFDAEPWAQDYEPRVV